MIVGHSGTSVYLHLILFHHQQYEVSILWAMNWVRRGQTFIKIRLQLISNTSQNTVQCTLFDSRIFFMHIARGKLERFPPAIVPIPVRTRKISPKNFLFKNCSGGTQPVFSSIVKRSHRYIEDFGRDSPAICQPREGIFHNFDFDKVLPVSKTTSVGNFPVSIRFEQRPTRYSVFCSGSTWIQSGNILSCLSRWNEFFYHLKGQGPLKKSKKFAEM